MVDKIFRINPTNNQIELNVALCVTMPALKYLIDRDGTANKEVAKKEIIYLAHSVSHFSPYSTLDAKERNEKATKSAGYGTGFIPDANLAKVMIAYKKEEEDAFPTLKLVSELNRGLKSTADLVDLMVTSLSESIIMLKEGGNPSAGQILPLLEISSNLNKLGQDIPKTVKALDDLMEKLRKELGSGDVTMYGERQKGIFEDED